MKYQKYLAVSFLSTGDLILQSVRIGTYCKASSIFRDTENTILIIPAF